MDFSTYLSQNIKKMKGGPFEVIKNFTKKSHKAKKLKRDPLGFFTFHFVTKNQKIEGETLWGKNFKKSHSAEKKLERGPFGLVRYCMLREKRKNLFGSVRIAKWFKSL